MPPGNHDEADAPASAADAADLRDPENGPPTWRRWLVPGAVVLLIGAGAAVLVSRSDSSGAAADVSATGSASGADDGSETAVSDATGDVTAGDFGPRGNGPGASGEVVAIDGYTLTVEQIDPTGATSELTVTATSDTEVTEAAVGALADLEVGDTIVVTGETAEDGLVAATIREGGTGAGFGLAGATGTPPEDFELPEDFEPPEDFDPADGDGGPPALTGGSLTVGEITSIDDAAITMESADGESVVVVVGADAEITVTEARSFDDIAVGDTIRAGGDSDGSVVTATSISIGDLGTGFGPPGGQLGAGGAATSTTSGTVAN